MKRLHVLLSVLVLSSLVFVACTPKAPAFECTDAIGCVDIAPGDPIHFAYIQSVSGATASLGVTNINGAQLAIDDKGGQLLGHPIQFDGEDSLCSAEGGQAAGTKIASDPTVVAILGTTCSSEARSAMPLIADAGMVMSSSSNTNPDLTNPEHPDHHAGYFRTAHNDLFQGRIAAEFAYNELGLKKAATVHDGSPYADGLRKVFETVFTELGGTITSSEAVNVGDTDFKPVLTTIAAGGAEIIYFPIFEPEGNLLASQKCEVSGLENTALMGADGLFTSGFAGTAGSCSVGMYLSSPYVAGDSGAQFLSKYQAKFGEDPASGFGPHSYDAMNIFFAAIEKVAVVDEDGTVHIGRQALRDAVYATKAFPGLTGNLSCDPNGDCATGEALAVYQITQAMVDGSENLTTSVPIWQP
ncbi:MAG: branched-chain amino acid ABC transporter substrate-binding protein [Anaerolineae bacterium]|nr:branched-chain amino acid ABC transporter substrate-binding protein [Anaerolineae bacterium]MBL8107039.1 branched-chain amino acid ABC transporter substrate-binding protein [Anaerolineales bacterium]MCC7191026.1 branched-chain amino acid ABC transporter substrate-binding protein [Anaerolineales bacterium]HQU35228.1 branched-chain amino acid ABC transporter substrate-binding protein [Anaerolineales bacterium]